MRRSFGGLHALVTGAMKLDAFAGHLFVFANRRKDGGRHPRETVR
jgi:transposase